MQNVSFFICNFLLHVLKRTIPVQDIVLNVQQHWAIQYKALYWTYNNIELYSTRHCTVRTTTLSYSTRHCTVRTTTLSYTVQDIVLNVQQHWAIQYKALYWTYNNIELYSTRHCTVRTTTLSYSTRHCTVRTTTLSYTVHPLWATDRTLFGAATEEFNFFKVTITWKMNIF